MTASFLRSCTDLLSSISWELSLNLTEMSEMARHRWYWRLHFAMARAYRGDRAVRVVAREAPAAALEEGQCIYGETPALSFLHMLSRVGVAGSTGYGRQRSFSSEGLPSGAFAEDGATESSGLASGEPLFGAQEVLFDLGCGRGLALLAAALALPRIEAVGIEVLPTFVERGHVLATSLGVADRVKFVAGDFRHQDVSRGTVFYAASTTFSSEVLDEIAAQVARQTVQSGRSIRFITLSHPLLPPWKLCGKGRYPMTWGWNHVYFHVLDPIPLG